MFRAEFETFIDKSWYLLYNLILLFVINTVLFKNQQVKTIHHEDTF